VCDWLCVEDMRSVAHHGTQPPESGGTCHDEHRETAVVNGGSVHHPCGEHPALFAGSEAAEIRRVTAEAAAPVLLLIPAAVSTPGAPIGVHRAPPTDNRADVAPPRRQLILRI
ncbi:MAG: hypothetical protein ACRD2X_03590, partial [Vicinamibacteraceae bacterium]